MEHKVPSTKLINNSSLYDEKVNKWGPIGSGRPVLNKPESNTTNDNVQSVPKKQQQPKEDLSPFQQQQQQQQSQIEPHQPTKQLPQQQSQQLDRNIEYDFNETIIGCNTSHTILRSAPKLEWLHISGLHKKTTTDQLITFIMNLTELDESDIFVLNIGPKFYKGKQMMYSTFKIGFPQEYLNQIDDNQLWPLGTAIRKFSPKNNFST